MRLTKLIPVLFIFLLLCTIATDGGLILAILLKIVFLKGALFLGTPMALGSFLMGQGIGFLGGGLAGSIGVLKAAHKYHEKQKATWHHYHRRRPIWKRPHFPKIKLPNFSVYGPPRRPYVKYGPPLRRTPPRPPHHRHRRPPPLKLPPIQVSFGYGSKPPPPPPPKTFYGAPSGPSPNYYQPPPSPVPSPYFEDGHDGYLEDSFTGPSAPGTFASHNDDSGPAAASLFDSFANPDSDYDDPTSTLYDGGFESSAQMPSLIQRLMNLPSILKEIRTRPAPHQPPFVSQMHTFYPPDKTMLSKHPSRNRPPDQPMTRPMGLHEYGESDEFHFEKDGKPKIKPANVQKLVSFRMPQHQHVKVPYSTTSAPAYPQQYDSSSYEMDASIAYDLGVSSEYKNIADNRRKDYENLMAATGNNGTAHRAPTEVLVNYIQSKLEQKSKFGQTETEKTEAKQLIHLLRTAYLQELSRSMQLEMDLDAAKLLKKNSQEDGEIKNEVQTNGTLPGFRPLPIYDPNFNYTTTEKPNAASSPRPKRQSSSASLADSVATVLNANANAMAQQNAAAVGTAAPSSQEGTSQSHESSESSSEYALPSEILDQFGLITNEIRQFFTILSILDQDQCLQKLVCNVHTRVKNETLSEYEQNIVSTFRILQLLLPPTPVEDDPTTKYRLASKLGELGQSGDICNQYYSSCGFSPETIVNMGKEIELSTAPGGNGRDGLQKTDLQGSSSNEQITRVTPSYDPVTMPKV